MIRPILVLLTYLLTWQPGSWPWRSLALALALGLKMAGLNPSLVTPFRSSCFWEVLDITHWPLD